VPRGEGEGLGECGSLGRAWGAVAAGAERCWSGGSGWLSVCIIFVMRPRCIPLLDATQQQGACSAPMKTPCAGSLPIIFTCSLLWRGFFLYLNSYAGLDLGSTRLCMIVF
jgi:hypothetical protein